MGYLSSATTIYATGYLTERGRELLFNANNIRFDNVGDDLFEITKFMLGDPDAHYGTTQALETGEVPDISGANTGCLNSTTDFEQNSTLVLSGLIVPGSISYDTNLSGPNLLINLETL